MYPRIYNLLKSQSFFLFGPRGTGKSTWLRGVLPQALVVDLLDESKFQQFLRQPQSFREQLEPLRVGDWVVVDEVQRIPGLLNYVHQLIEEKKLKFALTGSSARKLKKENANLLAGRALTRYFFPLTAKELGADFDLRKSLRVGHLPMSYTSTNPQEYLKAYVGTYLREEIQQEALVRNLMAFSSFLESISFSQASVLSTLSVAKDVGVDRKTVESYLQLLEDLLLAIRVPVFTKRAKRVMTSRPKFYYFDVGVFRTLRPQGPLDLEHDLEGPALETLVLQDLRAHIEQMNLDVKVYFYRTRSKAEVDFVLYGQDGFSAIEVTRSPRVRAQDLSGLRLFHEDYPQAKCFLLYAGSECRKVEDWLTLIPVDQALRQIEKLF